MVCGMQVRRRSAGCKATSEKLDCGMLARRACVGCVQAGSRSGGCKWEEGQEGASEEPIWRVQARRRFLGWQQDCRSCWEAEGACAETHVPYSRFVRSGRGRGR